MHAQVSTDADHFGVPADVVMPDIRGLDLSASLLPNWDVVAMIARELHILQRLALKSVVYFSYTCLLPFFFS